MSLKLIVISLSITLASAAFAQDQAKDQSQFENHKKEVLQNIEDRNAFIQKERDCINAAKDREALKKCREINREQRDQLREKRKEHHKKIIDEKIKKLQEQKEKIDSMEKSK